MPAAAEKEGDFLNRKLTDYELFMIVLGIFAFGRWMRERSAMEILFLCGFYLLLFAAGRMDQREGRIPDRYLWLALLLGLLSLPFFPEIPLSGRIVGGLSVSVPLFGCCLVRRGAFGGGDIKLMAGCGFFLGTETVLCGFAWAVFAGAAFGIGGLLTGRAGRKDRFPFGPFLCAGMALALALRFPRM